MLGRDKRESKRVKAFIITLISVLVISFLLSRFSFFSNIYAKISSPFYSAGNWVGSGFQSLTCGRDTVAEISGLERQVQALAMEQSDLESTKGELEALKTQCAYVEKTHSEAVVAGVYARSASPLESLSVFIDIGREAGIRTGDIAVIEEGIVAGKVDETTDLTAKILLLNHPKSRLAATIQSSEQTLGIVEGNGTPLLRMQFIPEDAPIEVDDLVVTSGLEPRIPAGLVIGIVNSIKTDVSKPFKEAVIEPLTDIRYVNIMTVLTSDL